MPELSPIQCQVVAGLLAGKSVSAVARENNIHRSTIYHWRLEHPYFKVVLDKARSRQQTAMFDLVQDLAEQAIEVVSDLLSSEDANLRLRAAQAILRLANPGHLSKETRSVIDFEALDAHTAPPVKFDTIRQNSTLSPEQCRNSRCACGSGLKYKRCCGDQSDRGCSAVATAPNSFTGLPSDRAA
jgi:transposase-like protein